MWWHIVAGEGEKIEDRTLIFHYFLSSEWVVFPCRPSVLQYLLWAMPAHSNLPLLVYFKQILPIPVMLDNEGSVVTRTTCGPQLLLCRIKWERKPCAWTGRVACVSCVSAGLLRHALHLFPSSCLLTRSLMVWLISALSAGTFSADLGAIHTGHVLQKQLDTAQQNRTRCRWREMFLSLITFKLPVQRKLLLPRINNFHSIAVIGQRYCQILYCQKYWVTPF